MRPAPARLAPATAVLLLAAACRQVPPAAARDAPPALPSTEPARATLVFKASTAGQLVPCGCSPDQRGGLPRAVGELNRLRKAVPRLVYLDAGDLLFDSALPKRGPPAAQAELKARTLARGEILLGAAARGVGPRDLGMGPQFVAETAEGVPLLDSGAGPVPGGRASMLVRAGEVPIGVLAAGTEENVAARAEQLRKEGARAVVLLALPRTGGWQAAQRMAQAVRGVDFVVLGRLDDPATDPNRAEPGPPPILAVEGHGQSLLRVDLQIPPGAASQVHLARGQTGKEAELKELDDRIARLREQARSAPEEMQKLYADKVRELEERRARIGAAQESAPPGALVVTPTFIPLTHEVPEDPEAKALVAAYDAKVTEMNLRLAQSQPEKCPPPAKGEAAFIGISAPPRPQAKSCAECHQTAAEFWADTRHAHAYDTLVEVKKQFSLDCVRCHVTGWQQPGGVCRIDRTAVGGPGFRGRGKGRQDVQCEMCHGPASLHASNPPEHIAVQVPTTVCVRCHEAENSPHFDDSRYRPFIVGPGHGEPLAEGEKPRPRASGSGPNEALKASFKGPR